jgi:hypothetical protein
MGQFSLDFDSAFSRQYSLIGPNENAIVPNHPETDTL